MTELNFKGKEFVYNHHLAVPFRPLIPHPKKGVGPVALEGNLIIHGDNLHALKALLPMYAGKVDCVFIDPPYNTGNEGWGYNDNVNSPMIKEWLNANPVGIEDGLRHDKWCAMMWPRLRLLYELMAENGSLWVTIDDNEDHLLRQLLDEVFGREGYIAEIAWQHSDSSSNNVTQFSQDFNTIYVYSKNPNWQPNFLDDPEKRKHFKNPDNDPRGPWYDGADIQNPAIRPNLQFNIKGPKGNTIKHPPNGWRWAKETMDEKFATGELRFSEDGKRVIRRTYLRDQKGLPPSSLWANVSKTGHTRGAKNTLKQVFGTDYASDLFATPKPVQLIDHILALATDETSLVLDSFAGSGTTAHAILEANKRDGGKRRFILVEMEDYADKLTAERVRRIIEGYKFEGTQRTELLRESLSWRTLERADDLVHRVQGVENLEGASFDRVTKQIRDSELIVIGEKAVTKRAEGLGGEFTYCTLGDPVELDKVLSGMSLPSYSAIGAALFHMATNQALDPKAIREKEFYLGETEGQHVWLIYKPDLDWLKTPEAALTLTRAKRFAEVKPGKRHLVFAPARFVSQKMLTEQNIPVEFVPLPFALYRIERS
ncbi:site-specific DNA-methyltransferase [Bradyrhizobium elkanii]|uniref:site-specific DNA-methyltransferase n=1 Tax=Bradyrhizobium elkanii TaxID=29448 RepID=UPI001AE6558F|nr:site-specific DNA-methyltransferase [Bradyrhizobium elkanii]MBP2431500.1 adenine-specific DNA-methyltransferase [Bradyrhizobium elkanii]WLA91219.1 site-specific DNA-methyltransferase [Bradyrhizobium elkanii]